MEGLKRLTRVYAAPEGTAIALDDDDLFDHPFCMRSKWAAGI